LVELTHFALYLSTLIIKHAVISEKWLVISSMGFSPSIRETFGQTNVRKRLKISLIIIGILVLVALIWIALIIFYYSGAHPYVPKPVYSPDGTRVIIPTINFNKADQDNYLLVRLKIQNTKSEETLFQVQTRASDWMRWSVAWIDDNTIILNSSDIGAYCWEENNDSWKETECPKISMGYCPSKKGDLRSNQYSVGSFLLRFKEATHTP
jgi:hypothetical protein